MKKSVISAIVLSLAFLIYTPVSFAGSGVKMVYVVQDKISVKPEDLPEPIKAALVNGAYANWEVTEAFLITKEDKTQFYEITVKNGSEMAKINLDKDGRKVE